MTDLLKAAIEAHGGMERWREVRSVDMRLNFSGAALVVKGFPRDLQPSCSIDVRECHVVFQRLGGDPDDRWIFTADRVWIERRDGSVLEERHHPRDAFAGHVWETKWDALHLTYFIGYAIWNYISIPFLLADAGFVTREIDGSGATGTGLGSGTALTANLVRKEILLALLRWQPPITARPRKCR
jgi:hypothetical protein